MVTESVQEIGREVAHEGGKRMSTGVQKERVVPYQPLTIFLFLARLPHQAYNRHATRCLPGLSVTTVLLLPFSLAWDELSFFILPPSSFVAHASFSFSFFSFSAMELIIFIT